MTEDTTTFKAHGFATIQITLGESQCVIRSDWIDGYSASSASESEHLEAVCLILNRTEEQSIVRYDEVTNLPTASANKDVSCEDNIC